MEPVGPTLKKLLDASDAHKAAVKKMLEEEPPDVCPECGQVKTDENPKNLEESRCGFANDPTHRPHEMTITGIWPAGVPNRWCVGWNR